MSDHIQECEYCNGEGVRSVDYLNSDGNWEHGTETEKCICQLQEPEPVEDEENSLPHTYEEVLQNLQHAGENKNFLEAEAIKHGVDFDQDTKDEFNREPNQD